MELCSPGYRLSTMAVLFKLVHIAQQPWKCEEVMVMLMSRACGSPSPDSSWWTIDMAADPGEVEGTTVVKGRCGGNVCRITAWVWPLVLKFLIIWTQNWTKPKPYYVLWVTVWLKPDVLWEELMVPERGPMFYFSVYCLEVMEPRSRCLSNLLLVNKRIVLPELNRMVLSGTKAESQLCWKGNHSAAAYGFILWLSIKAPPLASHYNWGWCREVLDLAMAARFKCSGFQGGNYLTVSISWGDSTCLSPFWEQDQCFWQSRALEMIVWNKNLFFPCSFHCRWLKPLLLMLEKRWRCSNIEVGGRLADGRRKTLMVGDLGTFIVACRARVLSALALQLRIAMKKEPVEFQSC